MAVATITEHRLMMRSADGHIMQIPGDYGVDQADVDFTAGHAESAAFAATTLYVYINVDTACRVAFGSSPAASASGNRRFSKDQSGFWPVVGGHKVSFVVSPS